MCIDPSMWTSLSWIGSLFITPVKLLLIFLWKGLGRCSKSKEKGNVQSWNPVELPRGVLSALALPAVTTSDTESEWEIMDPSPSNETRSPTVLPSTSSDAPSDEGALVWSPNGRHSKPRKKSRGAGKKAAWLGLQGHWGH